MTCSKQLQVYFQMQNAALWSYDACFWCSVQDVVSYTLLGSVSPTLRSIYCTVWFSTMNIGSGYGSIRAEGSIPMSRGTHSRVSSCQRQSPCSAYPLHMGKTGEGTGNAKLWWRHRFRLGMVGGRLDSLATESKHAPPMRLQPMPTMLPVLGSGWQTIWSAQKHCLSDGEVSQRLKWMQSPGGEENFYPICTYDQLFWFFLVWHLLIFGSCVWCNVIRCQDLWQAPSSLPSTLEHLRPIPSFDLQLWPCSSPQHLESTRAHPGVAR